MRNHIQDSTRHVYWDNRIGCYVALLSSIPTCTAEGATTAEALNNLSKTYATIKGAYNEHVTARAPSTPRRVAR